MYTENDFQTVQDLYNFFEPIPEDKWTTYIRDDHQGRHCALGHLDTVLNPYQDYDNDISVKIIRNIIPSKSNSWLDIVLANNYNPENPKQAVLDYLKSKM